MRRVLFTKAWALDALERAVKTSAQSVAVLFTLSPTPQVEATWQTVALSAAFGGAYSLVTSIASIPAPGVSPASLVPPA